MGRSLERVRRLLLIGFLAVLTSVVAVSGSSAAGLQRCHRNQLRAQLGQSNGAAGSVRISATFKNKSTSTCTLPALLVLVYQQLLPGFCLLHEMAVTVVMTKLLRSRPSSAERAAGRICAFGGVP